ncbi:hypothetical protein HELRODRAFT_189330 [Helobdella robusta]|uniref:CTCK domain-containing protein n=1 Tax=Helobdella robusta TaxID=6412 RepID=T1FQY8_HELRO|nr:hypothetical protein HELRODRAFT_189330 [Helobdella robusta]ESN96668.1 hypothetical protein HELRODRAFT_189330 [Helobdella robusta]
MFIRRIFTLMASIKFAFFGCAYDDETPSDEWLSIMAFMNLSRDLVLGYAADVSSDEYNDDGVSIQITADANDCEHRMKKKHCFHRPCPSETENTRPSNRAKSFENCNDGVVKSFTLKTSECSSLKEVMNTFCLPCQITNRTVGPPSRNDTATKGTTRRTCCKPAASKDVQIEMLCGKEVRLELFERVTRCSCTTSPSSRHACSMV